MNTDLRIRSPFAAPPSASPSRPPLQDDSVTPADAYGGTVTPPLGLMPSHLAAATPEPPARTWATYGRLAMAAASMACGLLGLAATASAMPPAPATTVTATVTQVPLGTLSNPARPLPPNSDPDTQQWLTSARSAFTARQSHDAKAFLEATSEDGVWVRGLQDGPRTSTGQVYLTHEELARDLQGHGPLSRQLFAPSSQGRFVVTPDAQGRVQTILLD